MSDNSTTQPQVTRYECDDPAHLSESSVGGLVDYDDYLAICSERDEWRDAAQSSGALGQWIASLRVGDTLTVDDIHRFVRVEMALRNADKHHQQARAMTAERDEWRDAAKWSENQHQYWSTVAQAAKAQRDAIKTNYDESVRECANVMAMRENVSSQLWDCMNERDGYRARLAACERVVEAACEWGKRYGWQQDMAYSFAQKELAAAVDEYRAAVAAETQGEKV